MRRPAFTAILLLLPALATAQVAPGSQVNPRAVWSSSEKPVGTPLSGPSSRALLGSMVYALLIGAGMGGILLVLFALFDRKA